MTMKTKIKIDRFDAMTSIPVKGPVVKTEKKDKKVYVTIEIERPGWQRVLGADRKCQRTFGLDTYGQEVYELCNGKNTVAKNVKLFAKQHHLSIPEAEVSVTAFLKTLMKKGLVGMAVKETSRAG